MRPKTSRRTGSAERAEGKWTKVATLDLPRDHAFHATPGHKLFVMSRGVLWLEYPENWHVSIQGDTCEVCDKPAPDDDCRLSVSLLPVPPVAGPLPIERFLLGSLPESRGEPGPPRREEARQPDVEIVWLENAWLEDMRRAVSRTALASGRGVLALLTFAYWQDDAPRCEPIWSAFLRTLQLGRMVKDPREHVLQ